jgi:hypothetical protein
MMMMMRRRRRGRRRRRKKKKIVFIIKSLTRNDSGIFDVLSHVLPCYTNRFHRTPRSR